jgi:hypothetical protein
MALRGVHFAGLGFAPIDHQQILHGVSSFLVGASADIQSNGPGAKRHLQDNLF